MYYSDEIIENVRSANDIVDVISSYVKLTKKGGSYFGLCPFHNEKTPSFSVSPQKQMYYCFGCGAGGNVITFVMNYENFTFEEALKMLADRAGIVLPEKEDTAEVRKYRDLKTRLLEAYKITANYYYRQLNSDKGRTAKDYFEKRNLTEQTMIHWGLGYSLKTPDDVYKLLKSEGFDDEILKISGLVTIEEKGAHDKFWNRAMFPIMDINNKVIGFGGRVLGDGEPKYLNSPETILFDKSRTLYGLNYARKSRKDYFLLCEGYMDVIALHQAGFTNAVASLGTSLTEGHANLIKRYVNKVIITYDSDGAGTKAAMRAIPILKEAGISVKILNMNPHKDPDEFIKALGPEEYEKRISLASNSFIWEIGKKRAEYDESDPEQKTGFEHMIAERLCEFTEPIERDNYTKAVSREFAINYENLKKLVNRLGGAGFVAKQQTVQGKTQSRVRMIRPEDGILRAQSLLISAIMSDPSLINKVKLYLEPSDYSGELYQDLIIRLYSLDPNNSPSIILNSYIDDPEKHSKVISIMNSNIDASLSDDKRMTAVLDAVIRIKQESLSKKLEEASDINTIQEIMKQQAEWKNKRSL